MAINKDDVIAEYGAYFLGNTARQSNLFTDFYRGLFELQNNIYRTVRTNATQWRSVDSSIGNVLQPWQKDWSPSGDLDFKPNTINLKKAKVETSECPDDFSDSYLMFLEGDGNDRKQWPFVRWYVEQHLIPKLAENISLEAIYKGVYTPPAVPGTAGSPSEAMDGMEKVQDDLVLSGEVAPIAIGAAPTVAEDYVTYIEEYMRNIPEKYRNRIMTVNVSEDKALLYSIGYQAKYGNALFEPGMNLINRIANFPAKVVGNPSMEGKDRVWSTLPGNAVFVTKKWDNHRQFEVASGLNSHYVVDFYTHLYMQVGFQINRLAFFTDQV